jgi:hypothetical protein
MQLSKTNEHEKSLANNFLSKTRRATLRFKKRLVSNVDELARLNKINDLDFIKETDDENNSTTVMYDDTDNNSNNNTSKKSKNKKLNIEIEENNKSSSAFSSSSKNNNKINNDNNYNLLNIPINNKPRKSLNAFDVTNFYHLRKNKKYLENRKKRSFSFSGLTDLKRENIVINEKDKQNNILSVTYIFLNKQEKYDINKSKSLEIILNTSSKRKKSSNKYFYYKNNGNQSEFKVY